MDHLDDKNPQHNNGMTPLHSAAHNGHLDVCKLIMKNILNKNPPDGCGMTPLHIGKAILRFEKLQRRAELNLLPPLPPKYKCSISNLYLFFQIVFLSLNYLKTLSKSSYLSMYLKNN